MKAKQEIRSSEKAYEEACKHAAKPTLRQPKEGRAKEALELTEEEQASMRDLGIF